MKFELNDCYRAFSMTDNFYAGECEECGEYSTDIDCCYNDLGDEKYLCPECLEHLLGKDNE